MIQFELPHKLVLDLFSGSGAMAIEALSRGATKAIAIEKNKQAIEILQANKAKLKINNLKVIQADVLSYLVHLKGTKFDFIFLDPPYKTQFYNPVLKIISHQQMLNKYGLIILETDNLSKISIPPGLAIQKIKKYGLIKIMLIANNI